LKLTPKVEEVARVNVEYMAYAFTLLIFLGLFNVEVLVRCASSNRTESRKRKNVVCMKANFPMPKFDV